MAGRRKPLARARSLNVGWRAMTKEEISGRILGSGVVAIVRAYSSDNLVEAGGALIEGGMPNIEITMTTPNALAVMADLRRAFGDRVLVGAGSILDVKTAQAALDAGAEYIVTPVLKPEVIAFCNRQQKPIFAGAYTPTEAQTAYELGADYIKIFPADGLGPKYIKAILGPLPHLKIVPTGGVDATTAGDFIKAGCVAVAAGSSLVSLELIKNRDWAKLSAMASQLVAAVAKARGK
jgi:2-dehydro-3-deoxyphosphogluconate aldolase / (4S)-4-hydroxy-2-oxoglutarate aldolase